MADSDIWHAKLGDGTVKSGTLAQLDEAYQAGHLSGTTLVRRDGSQEWSTLAKAALLSEPPPAPDATKRCSFCGETILAVAVRCKHCHANLNAAPALVPVVQQTVHVNPPPPVYRDPYPLTPYAQGSKSRVVYVLLGLFLGTLGIHNFYAGYIARGLIQLLITVFTGWLIVPLFAVGLWVIIELLVVNTDARGGRFA